MKKKSLQKVQNEKSVLTEFWELVLKDSGEKIRTYGLRVLTAPFARKST